MKSNTSSRIGPIGCECRWPAPGAFSPVRKARRNELAHAGSLAVIEANVETAHAADWRLAGLVDDTMPPRDPNGDDDEEEEDEEEDEERNDQPPVVREPEPDE